MNDAPKCLDNIDGIPFLYFLLENLIKQELDDFIFSLNHLIEKIINVIKKKICLFKIHKVRYIHKALLLFTDASANHLLNNL